MDRAEMKGEGGHHAIGNKQARSTQKPGTQRSATQSTRQQQQGTGQAEATAQRNARGQRVGLGRGGQWTGGWRGQARAGVGRRGQQRQAREEVKFGGARDRLGSSHARCRAPGARGQAQGQAARKTPPALT